MKYIKEYAFWNKDSIISDKILKNLDELKSSDIKEINDGMTTKYAFNLRGFDILVDYDADTFDLGPMFGLSGYTVKIDDVKIDISWNQGRKIYNKVKKIYNQDKKEEEEHIKKDARISL